MVARPPWMDPDEVENRLRGMGRKAVAEAHAAGVPAWYCDEERQVIRHDPDGRRWYVELPGGEVTGEAPPADW